MPSRYASIRGAGTIVRPSHQWLRRRPATACRGSRSMLPRVSSRRGRLGKWRANPSSVLGNYYERVSGCIPTSSHHGRRRFEDAAARCLLASLILKTGEPSRRAPRSCRKALRRLPLKAARRAAGRKSRRRCARARSSPAWSSPTREPFAGVEVLELSGAAGPRRCSRRAGCGAPTHAFCWRTGREAGLQPYARARGLADALAEARVAPLEALARSARPTPASSCVVWPASSRQTRGLMRRCRHCRSWTDGSSGKVAQPTSTSTRYDPLRLACAWFSVARRALSSLTTTRRRRATHSASTSSTVDAHRRPIAGALDRRARHPPPVLSPHHAVAAQPASVICARKAPRDVVVGARHHHVAVLLVAPLVVRVVVLVGPRVLRHVRVDEEVAARVVARVAGVDARPMLTRRARRRLVVAAHPVVGRSSSWKWTASSPSCSPLKKSTEPCSTCTWPWCAL